MKNIKKKIVKLILKNRKRPFLKKKNKIFNKVQESPDYKLCSFGEKNVKKKFYVIKRYNGGGLFSNFLFVLNHLIKAEKLNAIPVVDMENFSNYYSEKNKINNTYNSWLYYFEQVSNYDLKDVYKSKTVFFCSEKIYKGQSISYRENEKNLKRVFNKYIKIKSQYINEAENFIKKNFYKKSVLGVHWRGSDHKVLPFHPFPPTEKQMMFLIDKLLDTKRFDKIFLVTEEEKYLKICKKKYKTKLCYFNSFRAKNRKEFSLEVRKNHRYNLGKESLIEAIILSKLSNLLCSRSNISEVSKFMSNNKNYNLYEIMNGFNSKSIIHSMYLWYFKKVLPPFLGGFKNKYNLNSKKLINR